jgi:hypothetical protein
MIEVSLDEGQCLIVTEAIMQQYAGDPGTPTFTAVRLERDELKTHIAELIRVWRALKPTEQPKPAKKASCRKPPFSGGKRS